MEPPSVQTSSPFPTTEQRSMQASLPVPMPEQRSVEASSGFGPTSTGEDDQPQWSGLQNFVSSQSMIQNYMNFKITSSPSRLMKWSSGGWIELTGNALSVAKLAFSERQPVVEVKLDGNNVYVFDFYRMLLIDHGSGLQRSIAWIDVKGDCYFPKFFVDESVSDDDDDDYETPKIEVEVDIRVETNNSGDTNKRNLIEGEVRVENNNSGDNNKRKLIEGENEDTADSWCYRKLRRIDATDVSNVGGTMMWRNARVLGEGERSFSIVRDLFLTEFKKVDSSVEITGIRQFTHTGLLEKARWEAFHRQMEVTEAARGQSNTVFAWHGTSKKGDFDVLAHGFGWPSKVLRHQAHGVGVYFSPARLPHLSDMLSEIDQDGEKHLVLCRVILGKIEKVEAGSEQFHPSSAAFDSGADDLVNPKRYIVWCTNMNTHILPECVVSFKNSNSQNGQTTRVELLQWIPNGTSSMVAKLFSKLGSLLPAPKVEELKTLCLTYKGGKMAKDLFIKQLKFVVGNEILQSAISDIQGSK